MEDSDMYEITKKGVFDTSTEAYRYMMYYPTQGSDLNGFSDLRINIIGKDYHYHAANAYLTIKGDLVKKADGRLMSQATGVRVQVHNLEAMQVQNLLPQSVCIQILRSSLSSPY